MREQPAAVIAPGGQQHIAGVPFQGVGIAESAALQIQKEAEIQKRDSAQHHRPDTRLHESAAIGFGFTFRSNRPPTTKNGTVVSDAVRCP